MIRIGLDMMGGDYAPAQAVLGCIQALPSLGEDVRLTLIGDSQQVKQLITEQQVNPDAFDFVHTTEVIEMGEHPTKAFQAKKDSSISVGFQLLAKGEINAFISAGNTGAMMVGSIFSVKPIEGVSRPTITSILPKSNGQYGLLLDVGANADCKPEMLNQFAILGSLMSKYVYGIDNPKVGLMSIGEEKEKGNLLTLAAHQLLAQNQLINFIGNVEGRDLFNDKADVIVCDGFTGNVILKSVESVFYMMHKRKITDEYFARFNYENYGGTPILGVNAPVIIGHGISNALAFKNMILISRDVVKTELVKQIRDAFKNLATSPAANNE